MTKFGINLQKCTKTKRKVKHGWIQGTLPSIFHGNRIGYWAFNFQAFSFMAGDSRQRWKNLHDRFLFHFHNENALILGWFPTVSVYMCVREETRCMEWHDSAWHTGGSLMCPLSLFGARIRRDQICFCHRHGIMIFCHRIPCQLNKCETRDLAPKAKVLHCHHCHTPW